MQSGSLKKVFIFLMLGLLTVSAFFTRFENFKNSRARSIDEIVYYRMAQQVLADGPSGYQTIPYGQDLTKRGRPLPDYFFQPLFKHPPVFTFLIALSMKIFGVNLVSAEYVSLLFGVLMIPLAYLLGALLFNSRIGTWAALFLWIDPVSIMTSQKVWMDTTIAFFMLAGILLFVMGWKSQKSSFFIYSGLACGLAALTKYTGIFATANIALFAFAYKRELFRNKFFITSVILPFIMLLPWFFWNYKVYGSGFILTQKSLHGNERVYLILLGLFLCAAIFIWVLRLLGRFYATSDDRHDDQGRLTRKNVDIILGILLGLVVFKNIILSLDFNHIPKAGWAGVITRSSPLTFYITQLLEYSFIYFFAFMAFFLERGKSLAEISLLRYGALITLVFFTLWKSFQCRYILFAVPLLVILAFELIATIYGKISKIKGLIPRSLLKSALFLLIIYSIERTVTIDLLLSFPNNMCYF